MSGFFIALVSVGVILGFMILIHEFGHYAVAKLLGVRVEVFSIGFGKRLIGFRKGETDYRIAAIPLGGYVKMSGENPMDQRTDDPREFMNHPRWHRFLIAIAGPAMNIAFAIGLLTLVNKVHYEYPAYWDDPMVIGWVVENTPAAKAGIQVGDRITGIDELKNPTWQQELPKEALSPNQPLHITFERAGKSYEKTVVPEADGPDQMGVAGWAPLEPEPVITEIEPGLPGDKAGMQVGDKVISVDGKPISGLIAVIETLKQTKDKPIEVGVLRNGVIKKFTVKPVLWDEDGDSRYRIGIASSRTKIIRLPWVPAFQRSLQQNKEGSLLILELLQKMVQRKISMKSVQGPIGISVAAGRAARRKGWMPLLELTAGISLNLGIFNLLPIPILDGGVILLLLVEGVMRRDISLHIKERIYQTAFVFLVLFAVMVIFNDIQKTLPGILHRMP